MLADLMLFDEYGCPEQNSNHSKSGEREQCNQ